MPEILKMNRDPQHSTFPRMNVIQLESTNFYFSKYNNTEGVLDLYNVAMFVPTLENALKNGMKSLGYTTSYVKSVEVKENIFTIYTRNSEYVYKIVGDGFENCKFDFLSENEIARMEKVFENKIEDLGGSE